MPKKLKRSAKRVPARKPRAEKPTGTAEASPAHLPLQASAEASLTPIVAAKPPAKPRDRTKLPSNSLVRQKVLAIIAGRVAGKSTEDIAAELNITEGSVRQYMWLAGRNGWLKKQAVDPKDRLEFEIAHKVVRNLDEMLDSDDEARRDHATIKTAEGMLFKQFADAASATPPVTMIGVRVEVVPGANTQIREGTTGGAGHFVEGETVADTKVV